MFRITAGRAALGVSLAAMATASGATSYAAHLIDGKLLRNGSVSGTKLKNNSVDGAKLRNGTITGAKLKQGTIDTAQLAAGSVGSRQLAGGAVTSDKIAAGSVGSTQLAGAAVTSDKIAAGAVTPAHIADGALPGTKIAPGTFAPDTGEIHPIQVDLAINQTNTIMTVPGVERIYTGCDGSGHPSLRADNLTSQDGRWYTDMNGPTLQFGTVSAWGSGTTASALGSPSHTDRLELFTTLPAAAGFPGSVVHMTAAAGPDGSGGCKIIGEALVQVIP